MDGSIDGGWVGGWVESPVLHLKVCHSDPISDLPVGSDIGMLYLPFALQKDVRLFNTVHVRTQKCFPLMPTCAETKVPGRESLPVPPNSVELEVSALCPPCTLPSHLCYLPSDL